MTPTYTWLQFAEFRAHILSLGGSTDVSSGALIPSDADITGRYARTYSKDLPDMAGRTISFFASPHRPGAYGIPGYTPCVILTGCPWGSPAERDAAYAGLAAAGCEPNDMRHSDPGLTAVATAARS